VKGQKLFVRPIEAGDAAALQGFASLHGGDPSPSSGLIGKLVGELAAVLTMELETNAIRVTGLVVAKELRRKRIGRVMLNELANLAASTKREWLVAGLAHRTFLERVGFSEVEGVMRRRA
jgi:GNAT superfamily N-acetyltransferase